MKQRCVLSRFLSVLPVAVFTAALMSGCGKRFEAESADVRSRPPATSDPLTAEDQRRWDAAERNEVQVDPVLESEFERESFLGDLTEQKPAHTDDELAEEAEKVHKSKRRRAPVPRDDEDNDDEATSSDISAENTDASNDTPEKDRKNTDGSERTPVKPGQGTAPTQAQPPRAPVTSSPKDQNGDSATKQKPANPNTPAATRPARPATPAKPTLPARPTSSIRSEFCESLNVTSANANTDTTHLYNSTSTTAVVMPSKELSTASTQERKNRFVCLVLPMAIRMNEEVFRSRVEVLRLQAKYNKTKSLEKDDQEWLSDISRAYGVKGPAPFEELLKRIDIVPLPLLLAQAAIESGWGTSRATTDLNNLFGIHAYGKEPCKRGYDTKNACVRQFRSLEAGVSAYIQLINRGTYYPKFRELRAKMRKNGESLDSEKLLATLGSYNETPIQYIRNVREIMTGSNKLTQFVFKEEAIKFDEP